MLTENKIWGNHKCHMECLSQWECQEWVTTRDNSIKCQVRICTVALIHIWVVTGILLNKWWELQELSTNSNLWEWWEARVASHPSWINSNNSNISLSCQQGSYYKKEKRDQTVNPRRQSSMCTSKSNLQKFYRSWMRQYNRYTQATTLKAWRWFRNYTKNKK